MSLRPKQFARIGEFHLEEAILDVLLEAKHESRCLGPSDISKRAGIYRDRGKIDAMNDAIVTGMLMKLHEQDKVRQCTQDNDRGGWELTDEEFTKRRDDL